ncbi:ABC transporter ATP-binding protein [Thaumasiovibrio subtropicus]|uniref:ABC transporter ATP-binding protein n=1 Tax=Thaumasiovibrio subtropicus TaxID=1891207 RepID=UPI000B3515C7|nr:ABC transporter ATP-binding protein [Thaumasiovibrio subtropicus]
MTSPVIKADAVAKRVTTSTTELTILQDVSLQVESGQSVAFVGVSGAGKSTLMTLLAGLDLPSDGRIELLGEPISTWDGEQRAQLRSHSVGFVFQSFLLIPTLTALENVVLPQMIKGERVDEARAKALLAEVGLAGRESHLPTQLSGGEQQRVALARAFMTRPKVLFADEPTGNLDQQTAATIIEKLFALNRDHGTTLVLVTHDPALAARCDRVIHVAGGRIREEALEA